MPTPGFVSLSIPQSGFPNSSEDPKVASDLTAIQNCLNGGVDDTNLYSPNNGYRKLLLQANGTVGHNDGSTFAAGLYTTLGSLSGGNGLGVPMFVGDAGLSGQPQDFGVTNKSSYARVRVAALSNNVPFAANLTWGLYRITSAAGAIGNLNITLGTLIANSTAAMNAPVANSALSAESTQFPLPTDANVYVIGCLVTGTGAGGAMLSYTVSLVGYNA